MKRLIAIPLLLLGLPLAAAAETHFAASLTGNSEVPSISTKGTGTFRAYTASDGLHYQLTYSGLEGGAVSASHIHLGERHTNGGVIVFLCSSQAMVGIPNCPAAPARVTGIITAANVIGPAGQGISPGEFNALIKALGNGTAYANVHTATFPGGEIRGSVAVRIP